MPPDDAERLRSLLDRSPVGVAFLDADLRYRGITPDLAVANGRPVPEHIGHTVEEVSPLLWEMVGPALRMVRDRGEVIRDMDLAGITPDGHREHHFRATYFPIGSGPPFGVGCVVEDVTEQVRAEQAWRFLSSVTDVLAHSSGDVRSDLQRLASLFVPAFADLCTIGTVEDGDVVLAHADPTVQRLLEQHRGQLFPSGRETPVIEATKGTPQLVDPVTKEMIERYVREPADRQMLFEHGPRSLVIVPLTIADRLLGVLTLSFTNASGRHFGSAEVALAQELGSRVAQLLEQARLIRDAERLHNRLEMLARLGEMVDVALDVDARLERLPELVMPGLADMCSVYSVVGDELHMIHVRHRDPKFDEILRAHGPWAPRPLTDTTPAIEALRSGKPVLVDPVTVDVKRSIARDDRELTVADASQMRSVLAVPLVADAEPFGVLAFGYADSARHYRDADIALAQEVARRVSGWMGHALRFERQRAAAEHLQHALLPEQLPKVSTVDVAVRYLPGAAEVQVGGDWYDTVVLPDGRIMFGIGDVVGHGVSAAATMGRFRNIIEMHAIDGVSPREILERCNDFTHARPAGEMATALVAVLDPVTGSCRYARAGHLPPVVRRGHDAWIVDGRSGPPVGALSHPEYFEEQFTVERGDVVVLCTDGLIERRDVPIDDRLDALVHATAESGADDVEDLADALIDRFTAEHAPADDVAVLAFRRADAGEALDLRVPADFAALRTVRVRLAEWVDALGMDADARDDLVLAVNEMVANGMEHGGTDVYVAARAQPPTIRIEIRDSGHWRPRAATGSAPDRHRGRGIVLAEHLSAVHRASTGPKGTTVVMDFDRDAIGDASSAG